MDAISYLRGEHAKFRKQLTAISKIKDEKIKRNKFAAFCQDLLRHEKVEEKIFYPVLRKDPEIRDLIKHLVAEEKSAAKAMAKIKKTTINLLWRLRFAKFKHDVDHHAKEEEQELFPKVRKFLNKTELNQLGTKMRKFKASLK